MKNAEAAQMPRVGPDSVLVLLHDVDVDEGGVLVVDHREAVQDHLGSGRAAASETETPIILAKPGRKRMRGARKATMRPSPGITSYQIH
jgi:hypothetical protein